MCLVTGSFWGRPMWGTYWVWDARLTSVLILFLLYDSKNLVDHQGSSKQSFLAN